MEESVVEDVVPSSQDTFEHELIARMQECLSNRKKAVVFPRINWEQVAFGEHSAEECREQWQEILARLRVQRTLAELLDDAQALRWDAKRLRRAQKAKMFAEGAPVRPLSCYMLFCQKVRPKIAKKHPNASGAEMMTLLGQKYAALSEEKREKYRVRAAAAMAEYREQMKTFERDHPQPAVEKPPQKPPSAQELYIRKHAEVPRTQAMADYRALSPEEKARFIRKAQRSRARYVKAAEAFKELHPDWEIPRFRLAVSREDRKLMNQLDGVPRKPRSAYHLFMKDLYAKSDEQSTALQELPPRQRIKHCAKLWGAADDVTKQHFQALSEEEKAAYQKHLDSLPEEERPKTGRSTKKQRRPRRRKLTGKQLFIQERMPTEFDTLNQEEWRRILSRKFVKLSPKDKATFSQRAAVMNTANASDDAGTAAAAPALTNGHSAESDASLGSDGDLKRTEVEDGHLKRAEVEEEEETEESREEPRLQAKPEAVCAEPADVHSLSQSDWLDMSGSREEEPAGPRGVKRTKKSNSSPAMDNGAEEGSQEEASPKKKQKKLKKPVLEEEPVLEEPMAEEEPVLKNEQPSSAFEWFVGNFRLKSLDGLSPKKIKKKAKKAWSSLSDGERQQVEWRFAKETGDR